MVESITVGKVTELTLINPVKEGQGPSLRQVLAKIDPVSVRKMETIHFARWVLIDNDTRLLFTSNFDHTLDDYLGDFVRVMPDGLDRIWSHCEGYPSEGCRNYPAFSAWVRKYQVATTLWYAAYPMATVKDVLKALDVKAKVDQFQREVAKPPATTVGQV
ncbi:MAG: hypothetical protein L0Z62_33335 [Gemmataceae bacterium]|nr:hypothetical protein [Gemmataceae bacterium]